MWIRSQDNKDLINTDNIERIGVEGNKLYVYSISPDTSGCNYISIGEFNSYGDVMAELSLIEGRLKMNDATYIVSDALIYED